jgi:hypothetical protein
MDDQRGNHDIKNEMVFKSNPSFVFHDSCGFEAGSEGEFEDMKNFISERIHATKLEERIHAIWQVTPSWCSALVDCHQVLYSNGQPESNISTIGGEVLH